MKTVYVVNKGGHDYSDAERYGQIAYLTEGHASRLNIGEMYRACAELLNSSKPDDYILVAGMTQTSCVATSIMAYKHGRVNFLIFDGTRYVERTLVLGNLVDMTEEALVDAIANVEASTQRNLQ